MINKYVMDAKTESQISRSFIYHSPQEDQTDRYVSIRENAKKLAEFYARNAPTSRELSLALTALEESVMWVNAAISRNE